MHATARVAAVIAGTDEANTVESVTVEGATVRWAMRRAGGTAEVEVTVTDAAIAEYVLEVMAARLRVTGGGRGLSTSAA